MAKLPFSWNIPGEVANLGREAPVSAFTLAWRDRFEFSNESQGSSRFLYLAFRVPWFDLPIFGWNINIWNSVGISHLLAMARALMAPISESAGGS